MMSELKNNGYGPLPAPEPDPKSMFGVDKNINVRTLDAYLGRDDVAYRDVRMLFDPADYAAIGGNADLAETVSGFRIVPYPYLASLPPLPVKNAYVGEKLFTLTWDKKGAITAAVPNYQESRTVLEDLFPKDRAVFLMCGGGGYAAMTRALLTFLGWDPAKLYNLGAGWEYAGAHAVELIRYGKENGGETLYATWRADYALIDFSRLHSAR